MSPNVRPAADLSWSITGAVGTVVSIEVQDPIGELSLVGPPDFRCTETNDAATSTTLAGAVMSVTFPSAPPADFHISLPALNQGLRSSSGCYLAGGSQHFVPAATPPRSAFSRTGVSGSPTADVTVNVAGGPITITLPAAPPDASWWQVGSDGIDGRATRVETSTNVLVLSVAQGELYYFGASGGAWTPTLVSAAALAPAPFQTFSTSPLPPGFAVNIYTGGGAGTVDMQPPSNPTLLYVGCQSALGVTLQVNDEFGAPLRSMLAGEIWLFTWTGVSWGSVQQS